MVRTPVQFAYMAMFEISAKKPANVLVVDAMCDRSNYDMRRHMGAIFEKVTLPAELGTYRAWVTGEIAVPVICTRDGRDMPEAVTVTHQSVKPATPACLSMLADIARMAMGDYEHA